MVEIGGHEQLGVVLENTLQIRLRCLPCGVVDFLHRRRSAEHRDRWSNQGCQAGGNGDHAEIVAEIAIGGGLTRVGHRAKAHEIAGEHEAGFATE